MINEAFLLHCVRKQQKHQICEWSLNELGELWILCFIKANNSLWKEATEHGFNTKVKRSVMRMTETLSIFLQSAQEENKYTCQITSHLLLVRIK